MKTKQFILLGLATSFSLSSFAQNEVDALRFGMLSYGSTARSSAIGGAGGSLGGDFSGTSINPSGLGLYRSSEFTITPSININNTSSSYISDNLKSDDITRATLNNIGLVINTAKKGNDYTNSNWKSQSLAVGFNRLANFNSKYSYEGVNSKSSFSELMESEAQAAFNQYGNVTEQDGAYGYLGYEGYVLNDQYQSLPYLNVLANGGSLLQRKSSATKGNVNEWTISYGANYREKLLLGATLGLVSYKYNRTTTFSEDDNTGNTNNDFNYFDFSEKLSTLGMGFNLKLGATYIVNNNFRLGAAIHTPTWSSFSDLSDYSLTSDMENLGTYTVQPVNEYAYDYSLRTPWRGILSATAILGEYGFITADYEYVGYNSMKYNFTNSGNYESFVNQQIKDTYQGASNFKIGAEARLDPVKLRIGGAYYSSPFKDNNAFGGDRYDLTAGIGTRFGNTFIDLAYVYSKYNTGDLPYSVNNVPSYNAKIKETNNIIALTLGFKF